MSGASESRSIKLVSPIDSIDTMCYTKIILLCLLLILSISSGVDVNVHELKIGETFSNSTSDNSEFIFYFNMTEQNLMSEDALISQNKPLPPDSITTLKITANIDQDISSPVMFSIRYNYLTTSWNLPYSNR